jgi:hypothetical protein
VASDVLPNIAPDLVGYSGYETISSTNGDFARALAYLRGRTRPSFAFGANNLVLSEFGIAEYQALQRNALRPYVAAILSNVLYSFGAGVSWVLHWNMYDNECRVRDGPDKGKPIDNATEAQCAGYWVRTPSGGFGTTFLAFQPYLDSTHPIEREPADLGQYVDWAYHLTLGHGASARTLDNALNRYLQRPSDKESIFRVLFTSEEYRKRTQESGSAFVFDVYRVLLGRNPDSATLAMLTRRESFATAESRFALMDRLLGTRESRGRFVRWLFRRYARREVAPAEVVPWVDRMALGNLSRHDLEQIFQGNMPQ